MKAIRVHETGGPEVLKLEEVANPQAGPGQVVVRLHTAGVNPVDTYIRSGRYPGVTLPYTPGNDGAGVVESVGSDVKGVTAGDRVYVYGAGGIVREKVAVDAIKACPLPAHVSFAQGAAMGVPYGTAYRALFQKAHAQGGETVLVHGASGGVGTAAVQLARAAGLRVIGTAGTDAGLKLVQEQGAHVVLNHHDEGYVQAIADATDGQGPDVILEMLANVNLQKDLDMLAKFGRVVVIGNRGQVEIDPRLIMGKDAAVLGMLLFNASAQELASLHAALVAGLANGTLRPIIAREIPLPEAPRAHGAVMAAGALGKIVLTM